MSIIRRSLSVLIILTVLCSSVFAVGKLPAEKAGTIGKVSGQIGFIREGNIWTMNADGTNQQKITAVGNADGRMSWSPDNKRIIFTRSGIVDLKGPDYLGGKHKVYDLFLAYIDSAMNDNRQYWYRLTDDLGSRDPQWTDDGKSIIFWKDMNANRVNSFAPNYQLMTMEPDGGNLEIMRKDWQNSYDEFLSSPSIKKNGDIACVYFEKQRQVGIVIIPAGKIMMSFDSIKAEGNRNISHIAPSWSHDGKWLAVINNKMSDGGLYLFSADMKEKYLVTPAPVGTYMMTLAASFSPDSKWLTFATTDGSIWICDIMGNGLTRLTGPGPDKAPAWSK